jgi:hypothetical protein
VDIQSDDIKRKRFLWGACLAWIPFLFLMIPTAIGVFSALRAISNEKATGLAVLAGGLTEFLSTFGLAAVLVFEVAAIVLLSRTFSGERPVRAIFSVLSICCSVFMLTILGLFLWLFVFLRHR